MPVNWKSLAFAPAAFGLIATLVPHARAEAPVASTGQGMMDHGGMMGGNGGTTGKMPMMGGMEQMMEHCRQMMQSMNGGRPNDQWRDRNPNQSPERKN